MPEQKNPSVEKLLIPLDEAREMLGGISIGHLRNLNRHKGLKFVKVGRRTFIEKREIQRFLEELAGRVTAEEK